MNNWNRDRIDKLEEKINKMDTSLAVLETKFTHIINSKHAEALSNARNMDVKFKWISVLVGGISSVSVLLSVYMIMR